jgi:predicted dinucleotide-binding enzyme
MNNKVMVDPTLVPGDHTVFLSGDDAVAKTEVAGLLRDFGWRDPQILDLGALSTARATEQFVLFWIHINGGLGDGAGQFNIAVHREAAG